MSGYFCFGFIDFMFAGKTLIDFTILFSPYGFEKNDSIALILFLKWMKSVLLKQLIEQT